jgi:radical SAM-linked protein
MVRQKLLIRFRKTGDLRLISHRDLARAFERLFRRAELPLAMSQGFHPHARINFPSALALGIQGEQEVVETSLETAVDEQTVRERLVEQSPPGLEITWVQCVDAAQPKPRVERTTYQIDVPAERQAAVRRAIDDLLAQEEIPVWRDGHPQPLNLRDALLHVRLVGPRLEFALRATGQAQARPHDVLNALALGDLESQGYWLVRTEVHLAEPSNSTGDARPTAPPLAPPPRPFTA